MGIKRLNHGVLYVRDADVSARFYIDVLDFELAGRRPARLGGSGGAFLRLAGSSNDHDLALFSIGADASPSTAGQRQVGLYHLAWEVGTVAQLVEYGERLRAAGAPVGMSDHGTSKSLYSHDPDGLEFELCWLVPIAEVGAADGDRRTDPLHLDREIDRYGLHTPGHVTIHCGCVPHAGLPARGRDAPTDQAVRP